MDRTYKLEDIPQVIPINDLRFDNPLTQTRVETDNEHVEKLEEALKDGVNLDPIEVVTLEDGTHAITDGWHRAYANKNLGKTQIMVMKVIVPEGGNPEEVAFTAAVEANDRLIKTLTKEDEKKKLRMALQHPRWASMSLRKLKASLKLTINKDTIRKVKLEVTEAGDLGGLEKHTAITDHWPIWTPQEFRYQHNLQGSSISEDDKMNLVRYVGEITQANNQWDYLDAVDAEDGEPCVVHIGIAAGVRVVIPVDLSKGDLGNPVETGDEAVENFKVELKADVHLEMIYQGLQGMPLRFTTDVMDQEEIKTRAYTADPEGRYRMLRHLQRDKGRTLMKRAKTRKNKTISGKLENITRFLHYATREDAFEQLDGVTRQQLMDYLDITVDVSRTQIDLKGDKLVKLRPVIDEDGF